MTKRVHIVGLGARTPLGLNVEASVAAVRAGMAQIEEFPHILDQKAEPVRLATDSKLDPELMGPERLVEMAVTALEEVCTKLPAEAGTFNSIPLFLGLPEERPGWTKEHVQSVRDQLASEIFPFKLQPIEIFPYGHASGLLALDAAFQKIQAGQLQICIFAGVDSYLNLETLKWLDHNRQLGTSYHRGAFLPGEGVGAVTLASDSIVQRYGWTTLGIVHSVGKAIEACRIKTDTVCLGEGLTTCIRKAVANFRFPDEAIEGIICDINGERYRSEEWGFAILRLPELFVDPTGYDLPASCWGDMGAASGPLFVSLAVIARNKGWAKGERYLIWNSSEGGHRVAVVLEFNQQGEGVRA